LASQASSPINTDQSDQAQQARETVYLFNFLFPEPRKREFSKLSDFLQQKSKVHPRDAYAAYQSRFKRAEATDMPIAPPPQQFKEEDPIQTTQRHKVPSLNFK
jgi:hypothetical protein